MLIVLKPMGLLWDLHLGDGHKDPQGRRETTPLARVGGAGQAVAFPGTYKSQMDFNIYLYRVYRYYTHIYIYVYVEYQLLNSKLASLDSSKDVQKPM